MDYVVPSKCVSLMEYFKYLDASTNSRCVYEGEEVLNAGHIILCGIIDCNNESINVYALCLQTSALNSDPHEIRGVLLIEESISIASMLCSCKAGNSGRCKHISAVLIWCTRNNLSDLEKLSLTDIKCVWATQKKSTKEIYKAVSIKDMPCFQEKINVANIMVDEKKISKLFKEKLANSALAKHAVGRKYSTSLKHMLIPNNNFNSYYELILNNACESLVMLELSTIVVEMKPCCRKTFEEIVECPYSDKTIYIKQNTAEWLEQRRHRVTGSTCYKIFTYSKCDWEKMALNHFWPKHFTNKFVQHGTKYEKSAVDAFCSSSGFEIIRCGFIISNSNRWLGYSPDGIIFDGNKPSALLEVKCLFKGSTMTIKEAIKSAEFVKQNENGIIIKERHPYYGQIQLGMSLLNLQKCFVVLFASYDNTFETICVDFNYAFAKTMLEKVKNQFLKQMWHVVCTNK